MFKNLFNSRLGLILTRLGDLILLQLAFLVTSLPLVTVGAGIAALYSVSKKLKADSVTGTLSAYWAAFKENFRTATALWLCLLAAGAVLFFDLRFCRNSPTAWAASLQIFFYIVCIVVYLLFLYSFPQAAWFENSFTRYLGNSLRLALSHPGLTLLLTAIHALVLVLAEYARPLVFLIGVSGCIYVKTLLLCRLFFPGQSGGADGTGKQEPSDAFPEDAGSDKEE